MKIVFSCIISVIDERGEAACWMIEVSPGPLFFFFNLLPVFPSFHAAVGHKNSSCTLLSVSPRCLQGFRCIWCIQRSTLCVFVWLQWLVVPSGCRCVISHQSCSQLYKQRVLPAAGSLHRPGTESFVVNYWEKWSDC